MPTKESPRQTKWYTRVLTVLLILLPIIIILFLLLRKRAVTCNLTPTVDLGQWLYLLIFLVVYYSLLSLVWRIFSYIVHGNSRNGDPIGVEKDNQVPSDVGTTVPKQNVSKLSNIVPMIILIIVLTIVLLAMTGKITLPKIDTSNWSLDSSGKKSSCPATSAQTSTPCHSVSGGVGVSGVIVLDSCGCPSDTTFSQMDNITAGGPYKICVCK